MEMAKETYYFSHDYGARNDPSLIKLFMKEGMAGIGIFWCLIEMLYEQEGYLLLSELETYAFALHTDCESLNRVISDYGLFEKKEDRFYSNSVLERLELRKEKSNSARESAYKRWNNANAMQVQCEGNAIKERKGKEIKEKEIKLDEIKEWEELFDFWFTYKKTKGQTYKNSVSREALKTKLKKLSADNLETGKLIVEQSIANNWAGLFGLKNQTPPRRNTVQEFEPIKTY